MDTKEKLSQALQNAMKTGDNMIKNTVRIVLTNIKLQEVEKGVVLDDASVLAIIQKEIKSRHEVIEDARKISRDDIIKDNSSEIGILTSFLPEQLSETEIETLAKQLIGELGASSATDMGKVMKELLPKIQGKAPNNVVSNIVRKLLAG
jgi:uncharacterized protein YqeY